MKQIQKKLCLLLATIVLTGSLAACGNSAKQETADSTAAVSTVNSSGDTGVKAEGFPIVDEPITLSVFGQRDQNQIEWKNMLIFQEYEKKTNIKLDYQEVPAQGYAEKKSLLFASNQLPDIFLRAFLTKEDMTTFGTSSQQLVDLGQYIEKYAPNINSIFKEHNAIYNSQLAPDGKIYTLPEINLSATGLLGFKQWINKDWLDKAGMKAPTTLEELKAVLIAFRDNDPNGNGKKDEIPMGIREPSSIYVLGGSFGLDHQMSDTINIENGKIHYWLTDDRFKEYLQWLNELYKEKLLWQEYYKNDRPAWRSNLANASYGVMYMPYSDVFINVESQFTGLDPIKGPRGDQLMADVSTGIGDPGAFAVSNSCKYPEAAVRWVDYFYSEEGSIFSRYGIEGQTYHKDEAGNPVINDEILKAPEGFMTALGKICLTPGGANPALISDKTDGIVASALTKKIAAEQAGYMPEKVYAKPILSVEDTERVNTINQDLVKYRDEAVTKFIIGEYGFDKWDVYCNTINKIGMGELEQIYQKAFDKLEK